MHARKFSILGLATAVAGGFLVLPAHPQGFSPEESVKRMKVADGFRVRLVAAEPLVRQPVTMTFDDRGRLWVIQYLQYPNPAGLKPVQVDKYLRTVYDRRPEPPPKGPKGADRITILEDPDEYGRYRKAKDFVTGLNLASGMALGHGGVFVAQPPYLLFYADRDGDDVPDGDPDVLLTGFGMEDSHAFPNSLQWGPDGWLYGAQGSTVTANIRGIEFQQGIWRYHPVTRAFELFSEGGGNTWGVDFDRHGNVIAGTNWGGKAMLHQVQGGYYVKGFAKHGPLHNPHTYGYFDHVPYKDFRGGHVTCGGIVYQGFAFPDRFWNHYIAANPLSNAIHWHILERQGSSFTARFGGELVVGNDSWFRPVDLLAGPDGAIYVADWYDKRLNHVDPVDNWDRTNGRIYKIVADRRPGTRNWDNAFGIHALAHRPLAKFSTPELIGFLFYHDGWYPREARRLLAERRDPAAVPRLQELIFGPNYQLAVEAFWALAGAGDVDAGLAKKLLAHVHEDIRAWTVRLLGDKKQVTPAQRDQLVRLARTDASSTVRSQLACTAKRLPAADGLRVVRELLGRKEDVNDPHIPLLLWWAIEDKAIADHERVLGLLDPTEAWQSPMVQQHLLERIGRRYLAEGTDLGYATCARLLAAAPGPKETLLLVSGMEKALEGRRLAKVPPALEKHLVNLWEKHASDLTVTRFALRLGSTAAYERVVQLAANPKTSQRDRLNLIELLGQVADPACLPVLFKLLGPSEPVAVRQAVLSALQPFKESNVAETVLALYPQLPAPLRDRAQTLLMSRPASALAFVKLVDAGQVPPKDVPLDQLRRVALHNNADLNKLMEKHWGKIGGETAGDKQSRIRSVSSIVRAGKGDPHRGKALFDKHCATCHTLFGEGTKLGPDLTTAERKGLDALLMHIIDPGAFIRPEFVAHTVAMKDGRVLTGLIVEAGPKAVTLADAKNEKVVLARDNIEEMLPSPVSFMPDKLLDTFDEQELQDFFSYVQRDGPVK